MLPLVSIVIPTHNRPEMLANAIGSVLAQTVEGWELVVVDDGSSATTRLMLASFADPRIRSHRHDQARGASAARNSGLGLAKAPLVAFLDDDDTLAPDYLQQMLAMFERYGHAIDFAWPWLMETDTATGRQTERQAMSCAILSGRGGEKDYAAVAYTRTTGMMFRRSALKSAGGFDESLRVSEDRDLVFRLLGSGCGCVAVEQPLVNFFVHAGPRLSTHENLAQQAQCDKTVADRHQALIAAHPRLASRVLNLLARRQKDAGLRKEALQTLRQLLRIRPTDLRAIKRLVRSLFESA